MARATKLKVYSMPAGFYDAIVAAPSQAAALRAWGTKTDLFAVGRASIVEDEAIIAEALSRPGEVIKRSRGDEAAMLGPEPAEQDNRPPSTKRKSAKPAPKLLPPPDRSDLDTAERELADAERDVAAQLDAIAAARAELDRREAATRFAGEEEILRRRKARERAEAAYRREVDRRRR